MSVASHYDEAIGNVVGSGHTGSRRDGGDSSPSLALLGAAAPVSVPGGRDDALRRGAASFLAGGRLPVSQEFAMSEDLDPAVARALRLWVREMECAGCDALPAAQRDCGVCAGSGLGFDVGGEA